MKFEYLTESRMSILCEYITCWDMLRCLRARRGQAEQAMISMVMKIVEQEKETYIELIKNDKAFTELPIS